MKANINNGRSPPTYKSNIIHPILQNLSSFFSRISSVKSFLMNKEGNKLNPYTRNSALNITKKNKKTLRQDDFSDRFFRRLSRTIMVLS